jgi:hypothetical protein
MLREATALVGAFELVGPNRIIQRFEPLAFENPETADLRSWSIPAARLAGVVFLWLVRNREAATPGVRPVLGMLAVPALFSPRGFLDFWLGAAYRNATAVEPKSWVAPATRLLGLLAVLAAVWSRGEDGDTADEEGARRRRRPLGVAQ